MAERPLARALRAGWPALAWAGLIFYLSSLSHPLPVAVPIRHFDKLLHLGAFGILGGLLARGLLQAGQRAWLALLAAVLIASLYGALDEFHQSFVPGRDADPWDWGADTAGALLGAAAAVRLLSRKSRASIRG
jgi:VanZ family protein